MFTEEEKKFLQAQLLMKIEENIGNYNSICKSSAKSGHFSYII